MAWRGQIVDSRGSPSGLDDVALRACGYGREAEGLVGGENKIPRLKGAGGPVQCSRRCVTVGNAWTSKRIDKGDLPCARRGRDSCLSYDMRTMAQAHTADTLCARTDTTSAVFK